LVRSRVGKVPVRGLEGKEALVDLLKNHGLNVILDSEVVELVDGELVEAERLIATGSIDGIELLVDCYPWQCHISAPFYHVEPIYTSANASEVRLAIHTIVTRSRTFLFALQEFKTLLEKELPGFEVQTFAGGVDGYHDVVEQGVIKMFRVRLTQQESVLQVYIKAKDPKLLVELAKTLTQILRQGGG